MIAVVTLNPAIDKMDCARVERIDHGGKGTNVAKSRSLDELGVPHNHIDVPRETRLSLQIEERVRRKETELSEPRFPAPRKPLEEILDTSGAALGGQIFIERLGEVSIT